MSAPYLIDLVLSRSPEQCFDGTVELRSGGAASRWLAAAGLTALAVLAWYFVAPLLIAPVLHPKAFWARPLAIPSLLFHLIPLLAGLLMVSLLALWLTWRAAASWVLRFSPEGATWENRVLCIGLKPRDAAGDFCRTLLVKSTERRRSWWRPGRLQESLRWFVCLLPATSEVPMLRVLAGGEEAEARCLQERVSRATGAAKAEVAQFYSDEALVWSTSIDGLSVRMRERLGGARRRKRRPKHSPPYAHLPPQIHGGQRSLSEADKRELAVVVLDFLTADSAPGCDCLREAQECLRQGNPAPPGLLWDLELLCFDRTMEKVRECYEHVQTDKDARILRPEDDAQATAAKAALAALGSDVDAALPDVILPAIALSGDRLPALMEQIRARLSPGA